MTNAVVLVLAPDVGAKPPPDSCGPPTTAEPFGPILAAAHGAQAPPGESGSSARTADAEGAQLAAGSREADGTTAVPAPAPAVQQEPAPAVQEPAPAVQAPATLAPPPARPVSPADPSAVAVADGELRPEAPLEGPARTVSSTTAGTGPAALPATPATDIAASAPAPAGTATAAKLPASEATPNPVAPGHAPARPAVSPDGLVSPGQSTTPSSVVPSEPAGAPAGSPLPLPNPVVPATGGSPTPPAPGGLPPSPTTGLQASGPPETGATPASGGAPAIAPAGPEAAGPAVPASESGGDAARPAATTPAGTGGTSYAGSGSRGPGSERQPAAGSHAAAPPLQAAPGPVEAQSSTQGGDARPLAAASNQPVAEPAPAGTAQTPVAPDLLASQQRPAAEQATASGPDARSRLHELVRVAQAVVRLAARDGATQARISLEPAELGRVEIQLRYRAGGVHATLVAESVDAAQALVQGAVELRRALEAQGVVVTGLDVRTDQDGRPATRQEQLDVDAVTGGSAPVDEDAELTLDTIPSAGHARRGATLDLLA